MATINSIIEDVLANEGGYVNDPAAILAAKIDAALLMQSAKYVSDGAILSDTRGYPCTAPNCSRNAYASGFCNAHYIRARNGQDMDAPIRNRKRGRVCIDCGANTEAKGGWHRCAKCYSSERRKTIKAACVDHLGGACSNCGGVFPLRVFDFHHIGVKDGSPSVMMANRSTEIIAAEIAKCVLLCANCHRLEHGDDND